MSFNNLGLSMFFILTSTMPHELRAERRLYPVAGCGGNIEWHTEGDTLEIADRDNLLRDMRLYAGAVYRAANAPVHPLDFRATIPQIESALSPHADALDRFVDLGRTRERLATLRRALEAIYASSAGATITTARPVNDALLKIGRQLVRVLYCKAGPYRQDPALHVPLLPDVADAVAAIGAVPDGVLRTEFARARNRLDRAVLNAIDATVRVLA
jgi:hypothetical protein